MKKQFLVIIHECQPFDGIGLPKVKVEFEESLEKLLMKLFDVKESEAIENWVDDLESENGDGRDYFQIFEMTGENKEILTAVFGEQ